MLVVHLSIHLSFVSFFKLLEISVFDSGMSTLILISGSRAPCFAAVSANSFPSYPTWALIHVKVSLGISDPSKDSSLIVLSTVSDLTELLLRAFRAACESTSSLMYFAG